MGLPLSQGKSSSQAYLPEVKLKEGIKKRISEKIESSHASPALNLRIAEPKLVGFTLENVSSLYDEPKK